VFNGTKNSPYVETDLTNPLSVYGLLKLAGELAIASMAVPHFIFRTSWVCGLRGKNFLLTMLKLARERPELKIGA
jgi:dTDP-4-dehydrorhamnose reductase